MEFKDLKIGDQVYILENTGTFRKITTYNIGTVVSVTTPYDDNSMNNQYLSQMLKTKLVDINISCEGTQKKITVGASKTTITDNTIGLTISTSKDDLVTQISNQCKEYETKIAQIDNYREELEKCKRILNQLNGINNDDIVVQSNTDNKEIIKVS